MSEEVTPLELQYETINRSDVKSPEYESQVNDARHEVDNILAAGALRSTSIESQPEAVANVAENQVATPEVEPSVETLSPLQVGINIEIVRRAALVDAA